MKITINVDCSAQEAREVLGLPDVRQLQDQMMAKIAERMTAGLNAMDPAEVLRTWMPGGAGMEQLQAFFGMFPGAGGKPGGGRKE